MKRIKVLHISPDGILFGTERHILSIVKNSNKIEFEHWVSVPREGTFTEELKSSDIKYAVSGRLHGKKHFWQGFFQTKGLSNLLNLIRQEKFDIVHSHLNTYGGFIARLAGIKNIIHTRHGIFWTEEELKDISFVKRKFQSMKSAFFEKTIALSQIEKNVMVEYLGYSKDKVEVIYNGVTISDVEAKLSKGLTKQKLFDTDDFIVGGIGRFERQKGFSLLLDSAKDVVSKIKNIKFVIIGSGSLKEELERQINDSGLSLNVKLMDYQKNIFDYMNAFDMMVSASLWEGVPYVILEAMALGKPVIAFTSNLSGVGEMIENNKSGYLIEKDYVNNLTLKIIELYSNSEKLSGISEESRDRIRTFFSEQNMVSKTEQLYLNVFQNNLKFQPEYLNR